MERALERACTVGWTAEQQSRQASEFLCRDCAAARGALWLEGAAVCTGGRGSSCRCHFWWVCSPLARARICKSQPRSLLPCIMDQSLKPAEAMVLTLMPGGKLHVCRACPDPAEPSQKTGPHLLSPLFRAKLPRSDVCSKGIWVDKFKLRTSF